MTATHVYHGVSVRRLSRLLHGFPLHVISGDGGRALFSVKSHVGLGKGYSRAQKARMPRAPPKPTLQKRHVDLFLEGLCLLTTEGLPWVWLRVVKDRGRASSPNAFRRGWFLQPQHLVLLIYIDLANFERMFLIPIHLETQRAIEPARCFLWDRDA